MSHGLHGEEEEGWGGQGAMGGPRALRGKDITELRVEWGQRARACSWEELGEKVAMETLSQAAGTLSGAAGVSEAPWVPCPGVSFPDLP